MMPGILSAFTFSWSTDPFTVGLRWLMFWDGARPSWRAAEGWGACGRRPEAEPRFTASITWDYLGLIEWVQNITWALNCGRGRQGRGSVRWEHEKDLLVPKCKEQHVRTRGNEGGWQVTVSKESEVSVLQPHGPEFCQHLPEWGDRLPHRAMEEVCTGLLAPEL